MWPNAAPRRPDRVWVPLLPPIIWSTHFTVCYIWAALACGRFASRTAESLGLVVLVLTVIAVGAIGVLFVRALRQLDYHLPDRPNDGGTPGDRTAFMAYTTVLLSGMSLIATTFVGIAAVAAGGCQ